MTGRAGEVPRCREGGTDPRRPAADQGPEGEGSRRNAQNQLEQSLALLAGRGADAQSESATAGTGPRRAPRPLVFPVAVRGGGGAGGDRTDTRERAPRPGDVPDRLDLREQLLANAANSGNLHPGSGHAIIAGKPMGTRAATMNRREFLGVGVGSVLLSDASDAEARPEGEMLYNGIKLPAVWPPKLTAVPASPVTPPYLESPPSVVPIDLGRQLLVDDFLVEKSTLTRTFHQPRPHKDTPVLRPEKEWEKEGRAPMAMVFSDGVWYDPKDQLFKIWYMGGYVALDRVLWPLSEGRHPLGQGRRSTSSRAPTSCTPDAARFGHHGLARSRREGSETALQALSQSMARSQGLFGPDASTSRPTASTGASAVVRELARAAIGRRPSTIHFARSGSTASAPTTGADADASAAATFEDAGPRGLAGSASRSTDKMVPGGPAPIDSDAAHAPISRWRAAALQPRLQLHTKACCWACSASGAATSTCATGSAQAKRGLSSASVGMDFTGTVPTIAPSSPVSEKYGDWNWGNVQSAGGGCLIVGDKLYFYHERPGGGALGSATSSTACGTTGLMITLRRDGFASMEAGDTEAAR